MFGLPEDPDDSVDEYEGDDGVEPCLDIRAALEDCNIFQNRESPTPGPSSRSPVSFLPSHDTENTENIDPNVGVPNIGEYPIRMGGVDRFDQKRGTYEVGRRNRRWWCRIFYFLIDLAITNAFILHSVSPRNHGPMTNLQFRLSIARSLIGNYTSRKRSLSSEPNFIAKKKQAPVSTSYQKVVGVQDDIRYQDVGKHLIDKADTPRRCRLCSTKTNNVRSKFSCTTCKVFLCAYPCFTQFHTKN